MIEHPKYPRGNLYLSGGMEHAENLGSAWRERLGESLKSIGYFPLDIVELDVAYAISEKKSLYSDFSRDEFGLLKRKANIRKHFVFTDLELIKNEADALIVYYDESVRKGAGTISECQYAYNLGLPIFVVSYWDNWIDEVPGWLHALSTKIFTSFAQLVQYLDDLPDQILKRDIYGNRRSGEYYLCSLSGEPFRKTNDHFVSRIDPLYSKQAVQIVREVNEDMKDRYEFFIEYLQQQAEKEQEELNEEQQCHKKKQFTLSRAFQDLVQRFWRTS